MVMNFSASQWKSVLDPDFNVDRSLVMHPNAQKYSLFRLLFKPSDAALESKPLPWDVILHESVQTGTVKAFQTLVRRNHCSMHLLTVCDPTCLKLFTCAYLLKNEFWSALRLLPGYLIKFAILSFLRKQQCDFQSSTDRLPKARH